jgi:hypothetical protein
MPYYRKQLVTTELDPRLAALVTGSTYALLLEGDAFGVPTILAQGNDEGTVARGGEPIIYGIGKTAWAATNMARISDAPKTAELCSRVIGESLVWQGPSGRRVTIEHLLTIDN